MSRLSPSCAAFLALLAGTGAAPLSAQKTLCFNGSPLPGCSSFLIVEMQVAKPLRQSSRPVRWQSSTEPVEERMYEGLPYWELGMMRNLGSRWAAGGAARLGPRANGPLTGLTARARYWIDGDFGLDLSAGVTFHADHFHGDANRRVAGPLADARLNFRDDFYAGLRYESVVLLPVNDPGTMIDPGGRQHAISLLVGAGSEWAVGATALTALALLLFFSTADFR
jgi:hypothetical protein